MEGLKSRRKLWGHNTMSPAVSAVVVSPTALGSHHTRGEYHRWRHSKSGAGGGDGGGGEASKSSSGGGLMSFMMMSSGANSGDDKGVHQHHLKKDAKKVSFNVAMVRSGGGERERGGWRRELHTHIIGAHAHQPFFYRRGFPPPPFVRSSLRYGLCPRTPTTTYERLRALCGRAVGVLMRAPCPRMLTAALSVFTAAGGLSVAAAKKTLGPRISVFVVVVNIVRSVVNIVARPTTSSTPTRTHPTPRS